MENNINDAELVPDTKETSFVTGIIAYEPGFDAPRAEAYYPRPFSSIKQPAMNDKVFRNLVFNFFNLGDDNTSNFSSAEMVMKAILSSNARASAENDISYGRILDEYRKTPIYFATHFANIDNRRAMYRTEQGCASPSEIMSTFSLFSEVESMEIARNCHDLVFDPEAEQKKNEAVRQGIVENGGVVFDEPQFHGLKIKQIDSHLVLDIHTDEDLELINHYSTSPIRSVIVSIKYDLGQMPDGSIIRHRDKYFVELPDYIAKSLKTKKIDKSNQKSDSHALGELIKDKKLYAFLLEHCSKGPEITPHILTSIDYVCRPPSRKRSDIDISPQGESVCDDLRKIWEFILINNKKDTNTLSMLNNQELEHLKVYLDSYNAIPRAAHLVLDQKQGKITVKEYDLLEAVVIHLFVRKQIGTCALQDALS